jgi:hypothetical protein
VLYSFTGAGVGTGAPDQFGGLTMDASGNLYGTTYSGGVYHEGSVFELVNSSGSYTEKVLYNFTGSGGDGANPVMNAREMAQSFAAQGKTVRAAGLMLRLIETEPTPENLTLLAEIYAQQGLFDDAAALHLRVLNASRDDGVR